MPGGRGDTGRSAERGKPDQGTCALIHLPAIAHDLNARGVPRLSRADPGRNCHRSGTGWTLRTVPTIRGNPRYTGRQVWESTTYRPRLGRRRQENGPDSAGSPAKPSEFGTSPSTDSRRTET